MTGGNSPICYLKAYHTNLYLSADADKVREAIDEGKSEREGRTREHLPTQRGPSGEKPAARDLNRHWGCQGNCKGKYVHVPMICLVQ